MTAMLNTRMAPIPNSTVVHCHIPIPSKNMSASNLTKTSSSRMQTPLPPTSSAIKKFSIHSANIQPNIQPTNLRIEALVRDDPFNFLSFYRENIGAMVMTMPLTKLNVPTEQPLLLWATVSNINSEGEVTRSFGSMLVVPCVQKLPSDGNLTVTHPNKHQGYNGMPANVMIDDRSKSARLPNDTCPMT